MEVTHNKYLPGSEGLLTPIRAFLDDALVSEILVNSPHEVYVEKEGVMSCHQVADLSRNHLKRLFQLIANDNAQILNEDTPLLSGNLKDGSRVQLVLPPAAKDYTLSIRRKSCKNLTLKHYENNHFFDTAKPFNNLFGRGHAITEQDEQLIKLYQAQQWPEFIKMAINIKKNIVISGETSSGKTTFLNACIHQIPAHERIITIEDAFEVAAPHPTRCL